MLNQPHGWISTSSRLHSMSAEFITNSDSKIYLSIYREKWVTWETIILKRAHFTKMNDMALENIKFRKQSLSSLIMQSETILLKGSCINISSLLVLNLHSVHMLIVCFPGSDYLTWTCRFRICHPISGKRLTTMEVHQDRQVIIYC